MEVIDVPETSLESPNALPYATRKNRSLLWFLLRSLPVLVVRIGWMVTETFIQPYLINLGVSYSYVSLIWLFNPLCGMFVQPWVASWSDRSRTSYGRRRLQLIINHVLALVGLLCIVFGESITAWGWTLYGEPPRSDTWQVIDPATGHGCQTLVLVIFASFSFLDMNHDLILSPAQAIVVEAASTEQVEKANAVYACMEQVGLCLGSIIAMFPLEHAPVFESWLAGVPSTTAALRATFMVVALCHSAVAIVFILAVRAGPLPPAPVTSKDNNVVVAVPTTSTPSLSRVQSEAFGDVKKVVMLNEWMSMHTDDASVTTYGSDINIDNSTIAQYKPPTVGTGLMAHPWSVLQQISVQIRVLWIMMFCYWLQLLPVSGWWTYFVAKSWSAYAPSHDPSQDFTDGLRVGTALLLVGAIGAVIASLLRLPQWANRVMPPVIALHICLLIQALGFSGLMFCTSLWYMCAVSVFCMGIFSSLISTNSLMLTNKFVSRLQRRHRRLRLREQRTALIERIADALKPAEDESVPQSTAQRPSVLVPVPARRTPFQGRAIVLSFINLSMTAAQIVFAVTSGLLIWVCGGRLSGVFVVPGMLALAVNVWILWGGYSYREEHKRSRWRAVDVNAPTRTNINDDSDSDSGVTTPDNCHEGTHLLARRSVNDGKEELTIMRNTSRGHIFTGVATKLSAARHNEGKRRTLTHDAHPEEVIMDSPNVSGGGWSESPLRHTHHESPNTRRTRESRALERALNRAMQVSDRPNTSEATGFV